MLNKYISIVLTIITILTYSISEAEEFKKRVVSLAPHITETLFAIGAGDMVVGTSAYSDYPEQAKEIEVVADANNLSLERVLSLNPDLIVGWCASHNKKLQQLKALRKQVYISCPKTIADIPKEALELGKLLGVEETAKLAVKEFQATIDKATNNNEDTLKEDKVDDVIDSTVSGFLYISHKPLMSAGFDTIHNDILSICNVKNISVFLGYKKISAEFVAKENPDIIFATEFNIAAFPWLKYNTMDAVKNNSFCELDVNTAMRPSFRIADTLIKVCECAKSATN